MDTKKVIVVIITFIIALILSAGPVSAFSPHFTQARASSPDDSGNLTVQYKASVIYNLGQGINFSVQAVYACKPLEGDFLINPFQQSITSSCGQTGVFSQNLGDLKTDGIVGGVVILSPPVPRTYLPCAEGMTETLVIVTYSNLLVFGWADWDFNYFTKEIKGDYSATYNGYAPLPQR